MSFIYIELDLLTNNIHCIINKNTVSCKKGPVVLFPASPDFYMYVESFQPK